MSTKASEQPEVEVYGNNLTVKAKEQLKATVEAAGDIAVGVFTALEQEPGKFACCDSQSKFLGTSRLLLTDKQVRTEVTRWAKKQIKGNSKIVVTRLFKIKAF